MQAFKFALPVDSPASSSPAGNRDKSRTLFSPPRTHTAVGGHNRRTLSHQRSHSAMPTSATEPLLASVRVVGGGGGAGSGARPAVSRRGSRRATTEAAEAGTDTAAGGGHSDGGGDGDGAAVAMSTLVGSTDSTADPGVVSSDVRWKTSLKATKSLIDGSSQVERSADMVSCCCLVASR